MKYRYILERTETERKEGRYLYQIRDTVTGEVVSQRRTNREYQAAAAPHGGQYFGRPGLGRKYQERAAARVQEARQRTPPPPIWWHERPEDYPVAILVGVDLSILHPGDIPVPDMTEE